MPAPTRLNPKYINSKVDLPYGLRVTHVDRAVSETYRLFHGLNSYLLENGFLPLESLLLGNSLSGIVSEFLVKNIAKAAPTLQANTRIGGHPDLLPEGVYKTTDVLKGAEGIEVKASIQRGGWQGHNPEENWVMVFRYVIDPTASPEPVPMTFVEVLCTRLTKEDWQFNGRRGESRRTPTASITRDGVDKLRSNFLYRIPGVGVGRHRDILAK